MISIMIVVERRRGKFLFS